MALGLNRRAMADRHPTPFDSSQAQPVAKSQPGQATPTHWVMLGCMVIFSGTSFGFIKMALETAPPLVVASGRLWIAAILLSAYTRFTGRSFIPLRDQGRFNPVWGFAIAVGLIGYSVPMSLIPVAQQTVPSMLAGIYMAFMPIATVLLAALFADEPLTKKKLIGFLGGLVGVLILIGPEALRNILSADVLAQGLLVLATTGYAIASVIMRRAPDAPARSFAAACLLASALISTPPAVLLIAQTPISVSLQSIGAIFYLGIFTTGIPTILIITLVRGPGAGFFAMSNYLTPVVAIGMGAIFLGESLVWRYAIGLLTILVGLGMAQPGPGRALLARAAGLYGRVISPRR